MELASPTPELVSSYISKVNNDWRFRLTEDSLRTLFTQFPQNVRAEQVLLKVVALNSLYYTSIFDVHQVATHILNLNIDERLNTCDLTLVSDIAYVPKLRTFYSFATKYCSWHQPDSYPIYDWFVERVLRAYRQRDKFAKFTNAELRDYPRYCEIILTFISFYGVSSFSFRELDSFLWSYGKVMFPQTY